jgi:hypothetical protein
MRHVQREVTARSTFVLTPFHIVVVVLATSANDAIMAITISAAISPYSIAVPPLWSRASFFMKRAIIWCPKPGTSFWGGNVEGLRHV